jgi:hypothetical protein
MACQAFVAKDRRNLPHKAHGLGFGSANSERDYAQSQRAHGNRLEYQRHLSGHRQSYSIRPQEERFASHYALT